MGCFILTSFPRFLSTGPTSRHTRQRGLQRPATRAEESIHLDGEPSNKIATISAPPRTRGSRSLVRPPPPRTTTTSTANKKNKRSEKTQAIKEVEALPPQSNVHRHSSGSRRPHPTPAQEARVDRRCLSLSRPQTTILTRTAAAVQERQAPTAPAPAPAMGPLSVPIITTGPRSQRRRRPPSSLLPDHRPHHPTRSNEVVEEEEDEGYHHGMELEWVLDQEVRAMEARISAEDRNRRMAAMSRMWGGSEVHPSSIVGRSGGGNGGTRNGSTGTRNGARNGGRKSNHNSDEDNCDDSYDDDDERRQEEEYYAITQYQSLGRRYMGIQQDPDDSYDDDERHQEEEYYARARQRHMHERFDDVELDEGEDCEPSLPPSIPPHLLFHPLMASARPLARRFLPPGATAAAATTNNRNNNNNTNRSNTTSRSNNANRSNNTNRNNSANRNNTNPRHEDDNVNDNDDDEEDYEDEDYDEDEDEDHHLPHFFSMLNEMAALHQAVSGARSGMLPPELLFSDRDFTDADYEALLRLDEHVENRQGATQEMINQIPLERVPRSGGGRGAGGPTRDCAICIDKMNAGQMIRRLECSHYFHKGCVDKWLKQKATCPICLRKIL